MLPWKNVLSGYCAIFCNTNPKKYIRHGYETAHKIQPIRPIFWKIIRLQFSCTQIASYFFTSNMKNYEKEFLIKLLWFWKIKIFKKELKKNSPLHPHPKNPPFFAAINHRPLKTYSNDKIINYSRCVGQGSAEYSTFQGRNPKSSRAAAIAIVLKCNNGITNAEVVWDDWWPLGSSSSIIRLEPLTKHPWAGASLVTDHAPPPHPPFFHIASHWVLLREKKRNWSKWKVASVEYH